MLTRAGVPEARWEITRAADCRYGRQAYELTVPVAAGDITPAASARARPRLPRQAPDDLWPCEP